MAKRRRLGVALVLDPPKAFEVDGFRRALGDPSLARIPAHLTLVPPVNVRAEALDAAIERVRVGAGLLRGPLTLTLGPPVSFLPDNPVLYLPVGGDLDELRVLRDGVFAPPLERKLSWPWVPHVTLADGIDPVRIEAAQRALGSYTSLVAFDRVVLLEERTGRVWAELADAALERRRVVGTGGLALQITRGRVVDPLVHALVEESGEPFPFSPFEGGWPRDGVFYPVVMTGRREEGTVGVALAESPDRISVFVRPDLRGQGIGGLLFRHLLAATGTRPPSTGPVS